MYRLAYLLVFLLGPLCSQGQIQWVHQVGAQETNTVDKHVVDKDGNIVSVGTFYGKIRLGQHELSSDNRSDIFLYKTTPSGQVVWAKALHGAGNSGDAGVATDRQGNIYITGNFISEIKFDGRTLLRGNTLWNAFVAKLNPEGNLLWAHGILSQSPVSESRTQGVIAANAAGDVVVACTFNGSVLLKDTPLTNDQDGSGNLLIAGFSTEGALNWYARPASETNTLPHAVYLEENGNVYITGMYTSAVQFGDTRLEVRHPGYADVFISKLNNTGQILWAKGFKKASATQNNNKGKALAVDPVTKDVYLAGDFKGDVVLGAHTLIGEETNEDPGNADIFIAKLSPDGAVGWAKRLGTTSHDFAVDLKVSAEGKLILAGGWGFGPSIVEFQRDGSLGAVFKVGALGYATAVTALPNKEYYLSGTFHGAFESGNIRLNSRGIWDGFLLKIAGCQGNSSLPAKPLLSYTCSEIRVTNYSENSVVRWLKDGSELNVGSVNILNPESGSYQVFFENGCGTTPSEILVYNKTQYLPAPPELRIDCGKIKIQNTAGVQISWYRNGKLIPDAKQPELIFTENGLYEVQLKNACGTTSAKIEAGTAVSLKQYVPNNIITPNGDQKNDFFMVDERLIGASLQVYNRWGTKVYENNNYQNNWGGQGLAEADYFWIIKHDCIGTLRGSLAIAR